MLVTTIVLESFHHPLLGTIRALLMTGETRVRRIYD